MVTGPGGTPSLRLRYISLWSHSNLVNPNLDSPSSSHFSSKSLSKLLANGASSPCNCSDNSSISPSGILGVLLPLPSDDTSTPPHVPLKWASQFVRSLGVWRSLEARFLGMEEAPSSNLGTSTINYNYQIRVPDLIKSNVFTPRMAKFAVF